MLIVFVAYRLGCCFCQPRDIYATSGARTAAWEAEKWDEKEGSLACLWCLAGQFRALTQFILLYFGWATKGKLSFLPLGCIFRCAAGKCAGAWCWGMLGRRIRMPGHLLGSLYEVFGEATPLFNHQRYPCLCRKSGFIGLEVFQSVLYMQGQ